MAKTKTPFLSLGSRGTISDTLTSQKGSSSSILRSKPTPTDRYSLPQAYQRWLYEDYAYLWRQQSDATKATYRSGGVRHHLTGFQFWMKYMLTNLPDTLGWWHLDRRTGATTLDSSKNDNPGTIIGASPDTGLIDGCLYFDGINDSVRFPVSSIHQPSSPFSLEFFFNTPTVAGAAFLMSNTKNNGDNGYSAYRSGTTLRFTINGAHNLYATYTIAIDTWYHFLGTYDKDIASDNIKIYLNGVPGTFKDSTQALDYEGCGPTYLADWPGGGAFGKGHIDEFKMYNRILTQAEAVTHSLRRYPPQ